MRTLRFLFKGNNHCGSYIYCAKIQHYFCIHKFANNYFQLNSIVASSSRELAAFKTKKASYFSNLPFWVGRTSVSALFVVGIVGAIGDDDVVHELDAHEVACLPDASGQVVVGTAGAKTA